MVLVSHSVRRPRGKDDYENRSIMSEKARYSQKCPAMIFYLLLVSHVAESRVLYGGFGNICIKPWFGYVFRFRYMSYNFLAWFLVGARSPWHHREEGKQVLKFAITSES